MWNERFNRPDYLFGTEPADFLKREAQALPAGQKILCVADGEGRNSVFLAAQGHMVTAMDGSDVGVAKARKLAEAHGVTVDYHVADIATWNWTDTAYDVVVAIFIQFAGPSLRTAIFDGMKAALKPGGLLLLHGYTPEQLTHNTGGPKAIENLYTEDLLATEFADMQILKLTAYEADVAEGAGHSGRSALIDLVARKGTT